jgi:predicted nucleic acid-binding protein
VRRADIRLAHAWDSSVVADYLAGKPRAAPHARAIADAARRGECQIWVSTFVEVEVAYLEGFADSRAESIIVEFLNQDYVFRVALDPFVAETARAVIRRYRIKGKDAVHVASALRWNVPVFETFDDELIRKLAPLAAGERDLGRLTVREPLYEGQRQLNTGE